MAASFDPSKILGELTGGYMKLPLVQKIMFPLLIVGSIVGIIYVSKWANRPSYAVLYTNLEAGDSAAVIEELKSQKVSYEVRDEGSTIAISPPEQVHELRIALAASGVPKGGKVGFELFEGSDIGTTTFQEKIKWQRAIQGELERTIGVIEGVVTARVHVTSPEKSVFARKGSEPTASVLLRLRVGAELEKKQIKGIANLVAGSIEGLKVENVSIVDVKGNLLTPKDEGEESLGVEATRLSYQRELERSYVQRVEQMLSKVIGPEKVIARVTTELDFSQSERQEESYDPGGQVLRSERSVEEGSGSSQRGGVPGVISNLTNDPNILTPPGAGQESSARREAVKNYEVSRAVSKTSSPRGKLTRLSVAVLVDGTYQPGALGADGKAAAPTFVPLEPEVLARIEGVVRSAVGLDSSRGDTLTVENIPFYQHEENFEEELAAQQMEDFIALGLRYAAPILFLLLFFFLIASPLVKFLVKPTDAELDLTRLLPTGIQELEKELEAERSKVQIPAYEASVDLEQLEELMAENSRIVKENPHQAALLIRYWLNDGRL